MNEGEKLAIYVEMHLNNVHVARSPIQATVTRVQRIKGKHHMVHFLSYSEGQESKAVKKNAHAIITLQDSKLQEYQCFLICGAFFRRAKPYVKLGDKIHPGQRIGMIVFGSTIKIILPHTNYTMTVKLGEKVRGGKTILGSLNSQEVD